MRQREQCEDVDFEADALLLCIVSLWLVVFIFARCNGRSGWFDAGRLVSHGFEGSIDSDW